MCERARAKENESVRVNEESVHTAVCIISIYLYVYQSRHSRIALIVCAYCIRCRRYRRRHGGGGGSDGDGCFKRHISNKIKAHTLCRALLPISLSLSQRAHTPLSEYSIYPSIQINSEPTKHLSIHLSNRHPGIHTKAGW